MLYIPCESVMKTNRRWAMSTRWRYLSDTLALQLIVVVQTMIRDARHEARLPIIRRKQQDDKLYSADSETIKALFDFRPSDKPMRDRPKIAHCEPVFDNHIGHNTHDQPVTRARMCRDRNPWELRSNIWDQYRGARGGVGLSHTDFIAWQRAHCVPAGVVRSVYA